jgi:hypothetical protein
MSTGTNATQPPAAPIGVNCPTCGGFRYLAAAPDYTPCPDCCVCPVCGGLLDRTPLDEAGCACGLAEPHAVEPAFRP